MRKLGQRYVPYFNRRYSRSGTLWEGRFKSSLVDSDRYLLTCYRYIEMNPVRAAMVAAPADYRWSSYAGNALGEPDAILTPHPHYLALGRDEIERHEAYRELVHLSISDDDLLAIRNHVQQQRVLGTAPFQAAIEAMSGRCAHIRPRGRPARQPQPPTDLDK
jgi:putative transposase